MTGRSHSSKRLLALVGAVLVVTPSDALAHGEVALVAPASTVALALMTAIVFASFGAGWRRKGVLFAVLLLTHAALWVLPLPSSVGEMGAQFVALVGVPIVIATLVHAVLAWHDRRADFGGQPLE
jgi:hypothetical protein